MGMDGVEIVMAVEERFGIAIEDAEAERIRTPGQLIDLVAAKLGLTSASICRTRRAFHRIRRTFMSRFGCDRKSIRPEVRLDVLIPRPSRTKVWRGLQQEFGATTWPKLFYPPYISLGIVGCGAASYFLSNRLGMLDLINGLAGVLTVIFLFKTLRPMRTAFIGRVKTIGDLAHFLAGQAPALFDPGPGWTRTEMANGVKEVVTDILGCKNYREDADFVKDLGMG